MTIRQSLIRRESRGRHQVDVYKNLSSSKLDDDLQISVVLREAPQKLREHLLVNSQQFQRSDNKLRAIIQAYLNTNKTWIVNDFRGTDPLEVDYIGKGKGKEQEQRPQPRQGQKQRQWQRQRKTSQRQRVRRVRKEV